MKIPTAEIIRECDRETMEKIGISPETLVAKAAGKCADWLLKSAPDAMCHHIFCGGGNNGSDGLAIARYLKLAGQNVEIFIDKNARKTTPEFQFYLKKIIDESQITVRDFSEFSGESVTKDSVITDAVFGSGLNRKLPGYIAEMLRLLNSLSCKKIAIDLPSGLFADEICEENAAVFTADHTLSFQFYKKSFLHPETGRFCGKIHLLKIGLDKSCLKKAGLKDRIITKKWIAKIYRPRPDFSNKGTFGKACIIAGSFGKAGAAVMAAKAALKTGCGLTYGAVPGCAVSVLQTACPEAMVIKTGENYWENTDAPKDATIAAGPGIGTEEATKKALISLLKNSRKPMILDADALNILAEDEKNLSLIPENSILTPHPKEFERLFGETKNSFLRLDAAKEKSKNLRLIIVLKDHHTLVILPDGRVFYNITGNSGMAKGGSGDVLTGLLAGLLAQGYSPEDAAVFGVWLHGKAGDLAAKKHSKEAMLPTDLIEETGKVFKKFC